MITVSRWPGSIVEITIDGDITANEFDEVLCALKAAIDQCGSIRLLKHIKSISIPPLPWTKLWDDLKFGFEHLSDIGHIAVVADQKWVRNLSSSLAPILLAEVRIFEGEELEVARNWLRSAD